MSKRFVKEKDRVYWADLFPTGEKTSKYKVYEGYYLASYKSYPGDVINIILVPDINSCVVRHLRDCCLFRSKELAQLKADEANAAEERL